MIKRSLSVLVIAGALIAPLAQASAQEHGTPAPARQKWSFWGPLGKYDRGQLQRGFKVYREVCQNCHGLTLLSFRNLAESGGPGFSVAQATAVAAEYKIKDGPNDSGEMFERPGRLADRFPAPFPNDNAARASNGGALPPDLSVMAKARTYERGLLLGLLDMVPFIQYQEHGVDYITALLNGYKEPPKDFVLPPGTQYNEYFPGHAIGMPKPINDDQVSYTDGTPQKVDQYARDVSGFLMWAAEPHLDSRKRIGLQVMLFLIVFGGLLYFTKKKVWKQVALHPEELAPRPTGPGEYKPH
jgi:cytochrome c1